MGASRFVERAGAGALAAGTAAAMSLVPTIATAVPAPDPEKMSAPVRMHASGGWMGAITAALLALARSMFGRFSTTTAAPLFASELDDPPTDTVRTVAGIGPVRDIALSPDGRLADASAT